MEESIGKLLITLITDSLTHAFVNACFISKAHFGCDIFDSIDSHDNEFFRVYDNLLVRNLNLGRTFPQKLSHSRVALMGVGIILPKTAIAGHSLAWLLIGSRFHHSIARGYS